MASRAPPSSTKDAQERRSSQAIVCGDSTEITAQAVAGRAHHRQLAFSAASRIRRSRGRKFRRIRRCADRVGGFSQRVCRLACLLCGEDRSGAAEPKRKPRRRNRAVAHERAGGRLARAHRSLARRLTEAARREAGEADRSRAAERRRPEVVVTEIAHGSRLDGGAGMTPKNTAGLGITGNSTCGRPRTTRTYPVLPFPYGLAL